MTRWTSSGIRTAEQKARGLLRGRALAPALHEVFGELEIIERFVCAPIIQIQLRDCGEIASKLGFRVGNAVS